VLTLDNKNGRKFSVVLPPDSTTSKSFVDDAKKSHWINQMLHTDEKKHGMLLYLAQTQRDACVCVANQKKILMQSSVLNTLVAFSLKEFLFSLFSLPFGPYFLCSCSCRKTRKHDSEHFPCFPAPEEA